MIAEYESPEKPQSYFAPRIYGLTLKHKHLPEMQKVCGLDYPPVFSPIVDDYYKGMAAGRYQGVAPGAQLVCLKVLDQRGNGYVSDVLV